MATVNPPARLTLAMDLDRVEALSDDLERIAEEHEDAGPLMRALVRHFKAGVPHYHRVGIYMLTGGELRLGPYAAPAEQSKSAEAAPAAARLQLGQGVCGAVARSGHAEIIADANAGESGGDRAGDSADVRCPGGAPSSQSEIVVPILDGKKVLGVIDIDSDQPNAFNEHDQALLERAASLIAGAMLRAPERPHWEQPEAIR